MKNLFVGCLPVFFCMFLSSCSEKIPFMFSKYGFKNESSVTVNITPREQDWEAFKLSPDDKKLILTKKSISFTYTWYVNCEWDTDKLYYLFEDKPESDSDIYEPDDTIAKEIKVDAYQTHSITENDIDKYYFTTSPNQTYYIFMDYVGSGVPVELKIIFYSSNKEKFHEGTLTNEFGAGVIAGSSGIIYFDIKVSLENSFPYKYGDYILKLKMK